MPVPTAAKASGPRPVPGAGGKVLHEENSRTALTMVCPNMTEGKKLPQFLAAFSATVSALSAGTFFSWTSSVKEEIVPDVGNDIFNWIGSLLTIGAFVGCIFAGAAANRFGRQRTLMLLSLPMLLSWALMSATSWVTCLLLGRLLGGLAIGTISVVAGMYVSEIAEPSVRGTLGSFFQLQITIGILLGYLVGLLHNAKHLAYVNAALPVVFAALFWHMPESPVFLLNQGFTDRARESLQWLRGPGYDVSDEVATIRHSIMESSKSRTSIKDLFSSRVTIRGMVVALGLMATQQLSGINAIIFYTQQIFQDSDAPISGENCSIIIGVVQVLSTFLSVVLADRAGRRVLLLLSSSVMAACMAILGVYFQLKDSGTNMDGIKWLPLVAVAVLIVLFSLGLGPLPWCVVSEVFSPSAKGAASSIACAANWLMAFVVTLSFEPMKRSVGTSFPFFVYTAIVSLGTVFIALVVPETKGKTLDQILDELSGARSYPVNVAPTIEEEEDDDDNEEDRPPTFPL